jgi:hypothetical protein
MSFPDTCPDDRRTATNLENAYAADRQKKRPDPHLQQSFAELILCRRIHVTKKAER